MNWLAELFGVAEEHKHEPRGLLFARDECECGARLDLFGEWVER